MNDADYSGATLWGMKQAGLKRREICARTGLTMGAVGGRIWRYEQTLKGEDPERPDLFAFSLGTPFEVEGDALVIGDVHAPCTDYDWAQLVSVVGRTHLRPPRILIIAGDLFNLDFASHYDLIHPPPTWEAEKAAAKHLVREWLRLFDEVYLLSGNHERRIAKLTRAALNIFDLADDLAQSDHFHPSQWGHCLLHSGGVTYRVTHGRNYSVNQLAVSSDLANKYHQNIISHHQHHLAKGKDRFKRYVIVDNGALVDPAKLAYVTLDDSKSPNMERGFCLVKGGVAHLIGEFPFSDLDAWLPRERKARAA